MARPQLQISVPQPCSENWSEMTPRAAGRFCASCATTVVDFSQFTDKQLVEYFTRKSGKTCGRFSAAQLDRAVYAEALAKQSFFPRAFAAVALFLGVSSQTQAQNIPDQPVPSSYIETGKNTAAEKTIAKSPEKVSGDSLVISGRVIDAVTKEPIPFATVIVKDTKFNTYTDIEGNFRIALPDTFQVDVLNLVIPYVGYETGEYLIEKSNLHIKQDLILVEIDLSHAISMVGAIEIKRTPGIYLRNIWWKTKNLFRKRNYDVSDYEAE